MMTTRSGRTRFGGALFLALAVASSLPATVLIFGPAIGRTEAIAAHWVLGATAWVAWLAPTTRKAWAAGAFTLLAGVSLIGASGAAHAPGVEALAILMTFVLAVARSVALQRVGWMRGLVAEVVLGCGAVMLASWLAGPSILSAMAALWGFWLVQGLHPLLPGLTARGSVAGSGDPFDQAAARLASLLEDA